MADKLADDTLDKEEYTCFMHPETCDHMKDVIVMVSHWFWFASAGRDAECLLAGNG